jgi:hypothetical protein
MNAPRLWLAPELAARRLRRQLGCRHRRHHAGPPDALPTGRGAQQMLSASGGQIVLDSSDAAVFVLGVPVRAQSANITVTVGTASTTVAQQFQLCLVPRGIVLATQAERPTPAASIVV